MTVNITLTFPEKVIKKIDKDRNDINRSRYVVKLLEEAYNHYYDCQQQQQKQHKHKRLQQIDSLSPRSDQLNRGQEQQSAVVLKDESDTLYGSRNLVHDN